MIPDSPNPDSPAPPSSAPPPELPTGAAMPAAGLASPQPSSWSEGDWEALLLAIQAGKCTPFLGAGACAGVLPLGRDLAEEWAKSDGYPFQDTQNLVRVAQYTALMKGRHVLRYRIQNAFAGKVPDFDAAGEPHSVVAGLNLPVHITTNYDDFMSLALKRAKRDPTSFNCQWYLGRTGKMKEQSISPSPEKPVVYHLHGNLSEGKSLVVSEDDYLEFLTAVIEHERVIPAAIEQAFGDSAFLFLGYSLEDLNFKVLFRKLASYMRGNDYRHVAVQLTPEAAQPRLCARTGCPLTDRGGTASQSIQPTSEEVERAKQQQKYLEQFYSKTEIKVYWGTCQRFAADLGDKWAAYQKKRK